MELFVFRKIYKTLNCDYNQKWCFKFSKVIFFMNSINGINNQQKFTV